MRNKTQKNVKGEIFHFRLGLKHQIYLMADIYFLN